MTRRRSNATRQELVLVAAIAVMAALVGGLTGAWLPALAAATATYLAWHLTQLLRFRRRLRSTSLSPDGPPGLWSDLWHGGYLLQANEYKTRKKMSRFDARFRDAAADFPDGLVALSRSRNVRWCNQRAADWLFEQPATDVAGKNLTELIDSEPLIDYMAAGDYAQPLLITPTADRSRVLRIRMLPFGRKKHQLLLIASDITRIFLLDAARRDFVANVSHELRTPLTVITGYMEPLADHFEGDEEWSYSIRLMSDQAARMRQMIDDLTLLSRLESEDKPVQEQPVPVEELLIEVVRSTEALPYAGDHRISIKADPEACLLGDSGEIRSIISNLLVNALRHTPAGTCIDVTWERHADGATLSVADNGPGIAQEHLPRLTERFYRVDPARSRRSGGTGLGLAIVKHALSRHDAALSVESQRGAGSRFSCEFPPQRVCSRDPQSRHRAG